jgi:hypothetical protein
MPAILTEAAPSIFIKLSSISKQPAAGQLFRSRTSKNVSGFFLVLASLYDKNLWLNPLKIQLLGATQMKESEAGGDPIQDPT